jgi:hypothetical protein
VAGWWDDVVYASAAAMLASLSQAVTIVSGLEARKYCRAATHGRPHTPDVDHHVCGAVVCDAD